MAEIGTKVSLEISEPWDAYQVLTGTIIRSLNSGEYFVIQDNESNHLFIVTPRYKGDNLSDIDKGDEVIVGIAVPHRELDLLTVPEITLNLFDLLDYSYVGSIKKIV